MVTLIVPIIISCSDADSILNNIKKNTSLRQSAKIELIQTIQESASQCPVIIKKDGK